ncbi:YwaF family protein [Nesterenkonia natronophila]|uniref:TIGR02206 family membrane protein n=1 Tax=Nesterenkonia natronophila TaxID=2174932 RepID=A0A3A4F001_9MICC|nr:TIGR02206 family membrane protein [Nesterenkonia natronophila]RJN31463.1 TIGR02206 family membrane protein [Nesterenkonia natronophila]
MALVTASAQPPEVFGGVHLGLLGLTVVLSVLTLWGVRRIRGTATEAYAISIAGWALLGVSLWRMVWFLLPQNWNIENSLPLHFSDALRFIAAIALITRSRWAIAISYFWGLTLNPQALLTPHPNMLIGPSLSFFFYWGLHIAVLLVPLALIWGVGYRPGWWDFRVAYGAALVWAAFAMAANAILGTNYAFLNRHPEGASLLDFLGPWPVYVLWLAVIAACLWALMTWPWTFRRAVPVTRQVRY